MSVAAEKGSHSPGPWLWHWSEKNTAGFGMSAELRDVRGVRLLYADVAGLISGVKLTSDADEAPANAHLIAAAPDMLGALERAEMFLADECDNGVLDMHPARPVWDLVRAAIAKARGQS